MAALRTIEDIVSHIKLIENDNSSGVGLFLSAIVNRFCKEFAKNVDHSSVLKKGTLAVTSGFSNYNLGGDFLRPLHETSFVVQNTMKSFACQRAIHRFLAMGGSDSTAGNIVYCIGAGIEGDHFSAYISSDSAYTLEYWYFALPEAFSAASQVPKIPAEYIVEGSRLIYKNANGLISTAEKDMMMFQLFKKASLEESRLDEKISAYIYSDPYKSNKKTFR